MQCKLLTSTCSEIMSKCFLSWFKSKLPSGQMTQCYQKMKCHVCERACLLDAIKIELAQRRLSYSCEKKIKQNQINITKEIKQVVKSNIPSRRRFPISSVQGENGSLPTSTGFPAQNPETKKNFDANHVMKNKEFLLFFPFPI